MNDLSILATRGLRVLPQSHLVPVDVWLASESGLRLHLTGRGPRVRLSAYATSDLTVLAVRSECDCRSHRDAGAAERVVLRPGAVPTVEALYDGAARHGWSGVEAGRLRVPELVPVLAVLLDELLGPVVARSPLAERSAATELVETPIAV